MEQALQKGENSMINLAAYQQARDGVVTTEDDWPLNFVPNIFTAAFVGSDGLMMDHDHADIMVIAEDMAERFGLQPLDYALEWTDYLGAAA
jgi:hypothetical protein